MKPHKTTIDTHSPEVWACLLPLPPEPHERSLTAVALETMRREGSDSTERRGDAIPIEGRDVHGSDPDQSILDDEYRGDDLVGASPSSTDQNSVDAVGRVYGLQEEDSGALRSSSEILDRRDRCRAEMMPPGGSED
jgi:uncharacterized protein DUF6335